jgi:hypothetical protein
MGTLPSESIPQIAAKKADFCVQSSSFTKQRFAAVFLRQSPCRVLLPKTVRSYFFAGVVHQRERSDAVPGIRGGYLIGGIRLKKGGFNGRNAIGAAQD